MGCLDWAALIIGAGLIASGVRAIRRRKANVPEQYQGERAVRLGWLWIGLVGALMHNYTREFRSPCPVSSCS